MFKVSDNPHKNFTYRTLQNYQLQHLALFFLMLMSSIQQGYVKIVAFKLLNNNWGHNLYALKCCHTRAPSWILSQAENLASFSLQDGATKWYYNHWTSQPACHPPSRQPNS